MLENMYQSYGYGQQTHGMHQESYGMPNEYQNHVSGMQVLPGPCTDSSQLAKHQHQMFGGNHASYEDGWHGKNKQPNGWNGQNVPQGGWSTTTAYYNHASGSKLPPPRGFKAPQFPQGHVPNNMMKNAEYETYNSGPVKMRVSAMKYQQGNWKNESPGYQMYDEDDCYTPKGEYQKVYQEVEWKNQGAYQQVEWKNQGAYQESEWKNL